MRETLFSIPNLANFDPRGAAPHSMTAFFSRSQSTYATFFPFTFYHHVAWYVDVLSLCSIQLISEKVSTIHRSPSSQPTSAKSSRAPGAQSPLDLHEILFFHSALVAYVY